VILATLSDSYCGAFSRLTFIPTHMALRVKLRADPETAEQALKPYIIGVVVSGIVGGLWIHRYSTEVASVILLGMIAAACGQIYALRRSEGGRGIRDKARIWFLMALGFTYLALDEALSFHERLDKFGHRVFAIEETPLTDRADDVIILAFGIVGAAIMYFHRSEFRSLVGFLPLLVSGFLLLILMVVFDTLSNDSYILDGIASGWPSLRLTFKWLPYAEEWSKLAAEAIFLLCFLRAFRQMGRTQGARVGPTQSRPGQP
jgi:hypothetical protein